MTDYVDWLLLFQLDTQHLNPTDRENLKIVMRGGKLHDSDREVGPITVSSLTQYNQKVDGTEILPGNYEFGRLYKDYDFRTLAHNSYDGVLDIMNPIVGPTKRSLQHKV